MELVVGLFIILVENVRGKRRAQRDDLNPQRGAVIMVCHGCAQGCNIEKHLTCVVTRKDSVRERGLSSNVQLLACIL